MIYALCHLYNLSQQFNSLHSSNLWFRSIWSVLWEASPAAGSSSFLWYTSQYTRIYSTYVVWKYHLYIWGKSTCPKYKNSCVYVVTLQRFDDAHQELLFATVYLKQWEAQAHDAYHHVNGKGLLEPISIQKHPLGESCGQTRNEQNAPARWQAAVEGEWALKILIDEYCRIWDSQ